MRRATEIDTLAAFDQAILRRAEGARRLSDLVVSSVDLTGRTAALSAADVSGMVFLGCDFSPGVDDALRARGALIFPAIPDVPFDPYRSATYSPDELYGDAPYAESLDATVYAWAQRTLRRRSIRSTLAVALHDHAVNDALDDALAHTPTADVVGVMGGHALLRGDAAYADAARLGRALARAGCTVLTGGGPGAMEAVNLGAWLADAPDDALDEALGVLAAAPSFRPDIDAWVDTAREVRRRWPGDGARSVGIPTWFYGHEPPNQFAGTVAKFFQNAVREDTLVQRCGGGIVFLPGAAGTVQEIFADACENYYATHPDLVAPMVLVGRQHWTDDLPAYALLEALGRGRTMGERLSLVDDVAAAARAIEAARTTAARPARE